MFMIWELYGWIWLIGLSYSCEYPAQFGRGTLYILQEFIGAGAYPPNVTRGGGAGQCTSALKPGNEKSLSEDLTLSSSAERFGEVFGAAGEGLL